MERRSGDVVNEGGRRGLVLLQRRRNQRCRRGVGPSGHRQTPCQQDVLFAFKVFDEMFGLKSGPLVKEETICLHRCSRLDGRESLIGGRPPSWCVTSWCHPRAPNLDILTCVKDSHIWAIEHPTYSALTRPLCELSSLVPPQILAAHKKLRVYCMVAHPLQPHLVASGTNMGIILSEFDSRSLPAVAPLPTSPASREHSAVYIVERELKLLNFQLANPASTSLGSAGSASETGRSRAESTEPLLVKQTKTHISTPAPHDSYSVLSLSGSGKYVSVVWPDIPSFSVYKVNDWSVVDSGTGRLFAWDTCHDRYALLETALAPRMPIILKGGSSKKAKEVAVVAAAAASTASSATIQV